MTLCIIKGEITEKIEIKSNSLVVPGQAWANLECAAWDENTPVMFYSRLSRGNDVLIFNSSAKQQITPGYESFYRVNQNKNGLEANVLTDLPKPIYCKVNQTRSYVVQINRISNVHPVPVSNKPNNGFYIACGFDIVPKLEYSIVVDFFRDEVLFATFNRLNKTSRSVTRQGLSIINRFDDIKIDGKHDSNFNLTITNTGNKVQAHNYRCAVRNDDFPSTNISSANITIR